MNDGLFLVARVAVDSLGEDFLNSAEVVAAYDLYRTQYLRLDARLNIRTPDALLQYNRWVIVFDASRIVVALACFKTTPYGLKLGLTASSGDDAGKAAVKAILRLGLNVAGVFGEASYGVERVVSGRVPEVLPTLAATVLGKAVEPHDDGRHYTREITNVGPKMKLLVGKPFLD